jgi:hypothetical protein
LLEAKEQKKQIKNLERNGQLKKSTAVAEDDGNKTEKKGKKKPTKKTTQKGVRGGDKLKGDKKRIDKTLEIGNVKV